jgi:hypothetical protein
MGLELLTNTIAMCYVLYKGAALAWKSTSMKEPNLESFSSQGLFTAHLFLVVPVHLKHRHNNTESPLQKKKQTSSGHRAGKAVYQWHSRTDERLCLSPTSSIIEHVGFVL